MAEEAPNLQESLANSADGPAEVSVQGMGHSREFPLTDKIAAAKFVPQQATAKRQGGGMRFQRVRNGGAA